MKAHAVVMAAPGQLDLREIELATATPGELEVDVFWSSISTGTERLFWSGRMPPFPGMGYPLVPGYEAVGRVSEAGSNRDFQPGDWVFVPGARCFSEVRSLFGGSASRLRTPADRVVRLGAAVGADGVLLALAATAHNALLGARAVPELIVGHGALGHMLARIAIALGYPAPTVWERDPDRRRGSFAYPVLDPAEDLRRNYTSICDVSGDPDLLDALIGRLAKGGEITLAGFYTQDIRFAFVPAFLQEIHLRVAAEWRPENLAAVAALVGSGALDLSGVVTHRMSATDAAEAYPIAFEDRHCLKMVLNWRDPE